MTMQNTGYVALSHQVALRRQMEIIAHNIANATTAGFKSYKPMFEEYLIEAGPGNDDLSFVQDFGILLDFNEGPMQETGNPMDLAIHGDGFFKVEDPNTGNIFYTRNGRFKMDPDGQLATSRGDLVLGADGQPIIVDPALGALVVNDDLTLSVGDQPPVALGLVSFENQQELRYAGGGYFTTNLAEQDPAEGTRLVQGMLEQSNVNPVIELTAMIETSRAYQASQKMIDFDHDLQRKMAERMPALRA